MTDTEYTRGLQRLEAKMDRIENALIGLARMEERMVTLFNRMDRYDTEQRDVLRRVAELERLTVGRGHFFRYLDRGLIAAISAGVALLIGWFVKGSAG